MTIESGPDTREQAVPRTLVKNVYFKPGRLDEKSPVVKSLQKSDLFRGMSLADIEGCLTCSNSRLVTYEKNEPIFYMDDQPSRIMMLVSGAVVVGRDTPDGRRIVMRTFDQPGDLFGEVYLFVDTKSYDHYAEAVKPTEILEIPKEFITHLCSRACQYHSKLIGNTLGVLAKKAYFLDRRLLIMSSTSLREKIAKVLILQEEKTPGVPLKMTREQMAEYISTTRPSVSRELMNMQEDGLIRVDRSGIHIVDRDGLEALTEN